MSKSKKNVVDPNVVINKYGADAIRWYFYTVAPPGNVRCFDDKQIVESLRSFLLTLWNVYSFFSNYASLDNWTPSAERFNPGLPEGPTPKSDNPLDQWILARLNQVIAQATKNFEDSEAYSASIVFESLLDDLSNWYVRRSRRRFWKSDHDSDKNTAYATLWHFLVKMTRALAPVMPFVTEVMYQNLVRGVFPNAYESVHHTDWPEADTATVDEKLLIQMELARRVASLGLSARRTSRAPSPTQ